MFNPQNDHALTYKEYLHFFNDPRECFHADKPVGWNFELHALFQRELVVDVCAGSSMDDQLIVWDEAVRVENDQVMTERKSGSPKNARPLASMSVGVTGTTQPGDVSGNESLSVGR